MSSSLGRPTPIMGGTVLVVDDQADNLTLMEEVLSNFGFAVRLAADGEQAIEEVERELPDCIVLDAMMPVLDGFEACKRLKRQRDTHFIPIIMLTSLSTTGDKLRAFEAGADEFLNKPINLLEVCARVRSMVRIKRLRDDLDSSENIILSMIEALESKDPRAAGHSRRVATAAVKLAQRLGLPRETVEMIAKGAILHDIGKIGIAAEFPDPTTPLSDDQREAYEEHTTLGEHILAPFLTFAQVRALVRHHHERLDGSGFPDHVRGPEFTQEIEIIALTNRWDDLHVRLDDSRAVADVLRAEAEQGLFRSPAVENLITEIDHLELCEMAAHWQDLLPFPSPVDPGRVLVAHSDPAARRSLHDILASAQHEVVACSDGNQALDLVNQEQPDVLLLEADLGGISGMELSLELKTRPETGLLPIVLVTSGRQITLRDFSTRVGADDFLFLPVNQHELLARVTSLLRLGTFFKDLEEHQSVILSLASALEAKDAYTRGHSERVGVLAAKLGRTMELDESQCRTLRTAGQIHDIGKIGMPYQLLNKNGKLSPEEFEIVMQHPELGERICRPLRALQPILPLVRNHHERTDGSGYPDHLAGGDIPLGARILGLVDAYDALTSARSYRTNYSPQEAVEVLGRETRADRWDADVFAALAELVRRG